MKKIVILVFALGTICIFAHAIDAKDGTNSIQEIDLGQLTPEENLAHRMAAKQHRWERGGGRMTRPGTQQGQVYIVNCQTRASEMDIDTIADYYRFESHLDIRVSKGSFDLMSPKIQGNMTLFVVDDASFPPILTAPDSRWAMVNVSQLATGRGEKKSFFEARVRKQLSRGFAMLCGASDSQFPGALTSGISKVAELDSHFDHQVPVDVLSRFASYLKPFGVSSASYTSYKQACKEGWAPAPTNDIQKAIWNKVHEIPTEPIKIKYEKPAAK